MTEGPAIINPDVRVWERRRLLPGSLSLVRPILLAYTFAQITARTSGVKSSSSNRRMTGSQRMFTFATVFDGGSRIDTLGAGKGLVRKRSRLLGSVLGSWEK